MVLFSGDFVGMRFDVRIAYPCFRDTDSTPNRYTDDEAFLRRSLDHEQICACVTAVSTKSCSLNCTATADSHRYGRSDEMARFLSYSNVPWRGDTERQCSLDTLEPGWEGRL